MVNATNKRFTKTKRTLLIIALIIAVGYLIPEKTIIPVQGAKPNDWNKQSFWYEPWGTSGVHKGIDIFAPKGRPLVSSTIGLVLYTGNINKGGKVVLVLGPKWKLHYYAHLDSIETNSLSTLKMGERIGTVGDSGNAKGKPAHVHYSLVSLFPHFWKITSATQGWKKMFYLDPGKNILNK